jgi:Na+-translocating ferredoxin:NAD+ oxidoreductase RnfG subunit
VIGTELADDQKLYVARSNADGTGDELGYAAIGKAQGYSSKIEVMVGVDAEMKIIAIKILAQQETPGLGEQTKDVPPTKTIWRAVADGLSGVGGEPEGEAPFQKRFRGKTWPQLRLTKNASSTDAILQLTGATVTSSAVVNAVKNAITKIELTVHDDEDDDTEDGEE